jgi:hypothetical protein
MVWPQPSEKAEGYPDLEIRQDNMGSVEGEGKAL